MATPRGYFQAKDVVLYYAPSLPYYAHLEPEYRNANWYGSTIVVDSVPPSFSPWARLHGYAKPPGSGAGELHHGNIKRVRGIQFFSPFKRERNTVSFGEWGNENQIIFNGIRRGSTVEFNFNLSFSDPIHRALLRLPLGHLFSRGRNTPNDVPADDFMMLYFNKRPDLQPSARFSRQYWNAGQSRLVVRAQNVGGMASEEALIIIKGELIKKELTPPDGVEGSWFNVTIGIELAEDLILRINPFQEVK